MPSAPPGRYQSRLFNFVNRQSQRLTDQYDRRVRQLKVAAVWGVQILLYPVYLIVQAGLSAGRQLTQSAEAGWPQLKALTKSQPQQEIPPEADTPIQQVLAAVNTLALAGVGSWELGFTVQPFGYISEAARSANSKAEHSPKKVGSGDKEDKDNEDKETINSPSFLSSNQFLPPDASSPLACSPAEIIVSTSSNLSQTSQELAASHCVIQGVATLLETRTLALVTVDNQILDILTPQQQQKLSSKISWELANFRRQWRLAEASARRQLIQPRRFSIRESQPRVLAPVRLFWHLMAWVQTSPIAIAANLFQEANLFEGINLSLNPIPAQPKHQQPALNGQEITPHLAPQSQINFASAQEAIVGAAAKQIAFLDRTVAELETHQLVPGSEVVVSLSERATRSIKASTQQLRKQLQVPFLKQDSQATSSDISQTNTLGIQALIYAAVDYFFGKQQRSNLPGTNSQEQQFIPGNSHGGNHQLLGHQSNSLPSSTELSSLEFADSPETDPWLSWDDLYDNSRIASQAQNLTSPTAGKIKKKSPAQLPEAFNSKTPVKPGNSILGAIKRYLGFNQTSGKLSAPSTPQSSVESAPLIVQNPAQLNTQLPNKSNTQTKSKTSFPNAIKSHSIKALSNKTAASTITTPSADSHLEAKPDWIETPATPNGYVKHPLEQLLGWLDSAMLWLEELVVKVWRWVQGR